MNLARRVDSSVPVISRSQVVRVSGSAGGSHPLCQWIPPNSIPPLCTLLSSVLLFAFSAPMYARAAFESASRAASAARAQEQVDPDLSSPNRPCPVAFDEDITEAPGDFPDLSVAAPLSAQEVLVPAHTLSPDQGSFRQQLLATLQSAFSTSAASGTVRTYESALRAIAPKIALKLGAQVSPMRSACQF